MKIYPGLCGNIRGCVSILIRGVRIYPGCEDISGVVWVFLGTRICISGVYVLVIHVARVGS